MRPLEDLDTKDEAEEEDDLLADDVTRSHEEAMRSREEVIRSEERVEVKVEKEDAETKVDVTTIQNNSLLGKHKYCFFTYKLDPKHLLRNILNWIFG